MSGDETKMRTIVLAGAPEAKDLDWDEKALTAAHDVRRDSMSASPPLTMSQQSQQTQQIPKWRKLEMERLRMRPILPKLDIDQRPTEAEMAETTEFLDTTELLSQELMQEAASTTTGSDVSNEDSRPSCESYEPESQALADFYNHSFTIHEAMPSSRISDMMPLTPGTPVYESNDELFSERSNSPSGIIRSSSQRRLSQVPKPKQMSDLDQLPNARVIECMGAYKSRINMIVGVISISQPRKVPIRNDPGRKAELVEMVVGDETKSGLCVTMWLPREMRVNWQDGKQEKPEGRRSELRRTLKNIRPQDIILLQNVALGTWKGKVQANSLSDVTKIDVLYRKKVDDEEQISCYSAQNLRMATAKDTQMLKVKKVRDWMADFLGEAPVRGGRRKTRGRLPPDTQ